MVLFLQGDFVLEEHAGQFNVKDMFVCLYEAGEYGIMASAKG
jgi:hypothetical protein